MTLHAAVLQPGNLHVQTRRFLRWLGLTVGIVLFVWLLSLTLSPWYRLGINGTESLPGMFYLVLKTEAPANRGDLVAFYPPENRYYPQGMFFIKKVMGMPGDEVTREGRDFHINRDYIASAKPRSRSGQSLQAGPAGVIPVGHYFVWTPHPDSYDSRYEDIGWISQDCIIGRAVRVF